MYFFKLFTFMFDIFGFKFIEISTVCIARNVKHCIKKYFSLFIILIDNQLRSCPNTNNSSILPYSSIEYIEI
ncbi:unnamed protein product [Acanthoscelides obtectus]|uniref:Uncharacterized protein n=1 Tax=Acanthoscelides obtectus TaxID=200917 RepID=A0A9P0JQ27_ACAOB|nr:unnamed protein product [Acanthoscelides obtectus]CAK1628867.1 hypothetical protein AOBTE_LOCUS5441 [Acanthoscelides obtectus]